MRPIILFNSILLILLFTQASAQNVEQIIDRYIERVGGEDMLGNIKGMVMTGTFKQGDLEFPIRQVIMTDGRQYMEMTFMGRQIKQRVYDGKTLWDEEISTGAAEAADDETTYNFKLGLNDFPDALYKYKQKGYQVAFVGKVTKKGKETYKIAVQRENTIVEGIEKKDIVYYYLDVDSGLSLFQESAPADGAGASKVAILEFSDYQLVEGKYLMPFTLIQTMEGENVFELRIKKVVLDPVVTDEEFKFPG
ncbi:MAG: outer membrane lipoprotein-sorting protein [Bacteroidota bacterium]